VTFALTADTDTWNRIYSRESASNMPQLAINGGEGSTAMAAPMTLSSQPSSASPAMWSPEPEEEAGALTSL
jgi:hypothetical protein